MIVGVLAGVTEGAGVGGTGSSGVDAAHAVRMTVNKMSKNDFRILSPRGIQGHYQLITKARYCVQRMLFATIVTFIFTLALLA